MNKVILIGRLVREPEIRYGQGNDSKIARYTLAVDRKFKREGEVTADFIPCITFGKAADFAEKYLKKGTKIAIVGRIQTGSYVNKDGQKVYTTDVIVEEQEFAESKNASGSVVPSQNETSIPPASTGDDFMSIPDNMDDESLPFN